MRFRVDCFEKPTSVHPIKVDVGGWDAAMTMARERCRFGHETRVRDTWAPKYQGEPLVIAKFINRDGEAVGVNPHEVW